MNKFFSIKSLSAQLFCSVLLSLLTMAAVFIPSVEFGNRLLSKTVYGKPFINQMADQQFEDLQKYVQQREITTDNLYLLNAWCSRGDKVYLAIYLHGYIVYESHQHINTQDLEMANYDVSFEDEDHEYTLTLSDGTVVQAFLYYYAGDAFYYWVLTVAGVLAFTVFSCCFIGFVNHKLRYVKQLKRELDILAGGDLSYQVTKKGQDELAELAYGIDQMRLSILAYQELEEQIRLQNTAQSISSKNNLAD